MPNHVSRNTSISTGVVLPVLDALGWAIFDPALVLPQYKLDDRSGGRGASRWVDFALLTRGTPAVFVEVKQPGTIDGADRQLFEYAFHEGVPMAVLTDGATWHVYLPAMQGSYDERRVYLLDLAERDPADSAERLARYLGRAAVESGEAEERAKADYRRSRQRRESVGAIPQAWANLVAGTRLADLVAAEAESVRGFAPHPDDVAAFLASLQPGGSVPFFPLPAKAHPKTVPAVSAEPSSSSPAEGKNALGVVVHGSLLPCRTATDALVLWFQTLEKLRPGFLVRFAAEDTHGRTRRYLATRPEDLYPERPDLARHSREVAPGFWLATNTNTELKERIGLRAAVLRAFAQATVSRYVSGRRNEATCLTVGMAMRFLLIAALLAGTADAQPADTLRLPAVRVEATRGLGGTASAPVAVAVAEREAAERASDAGASLELALRRLPGVLLADRQNPAVGERLVVRGLGARAGFGVRGVAVVLDGVPLTFADGQAVLGIADPALVRRVEVVRGPASALWGNGAGGVVALETIPAPGERATSARLAAGADGLRRADAEATAAVGCARVGVAASHTRGDGFRDHAAFRVSRARAFSDLPLGPRAALRLVAAVEDAPRLEHPGALTPDEAAADPRAAEARFVTTASGKANRQGQLAALAQTETALGRVDGALYGVARDLTNPLPFAVINVGRLAGGARLGLEREAGPLRLALGADASAQRDARVNRPNVGGVPGETRTVDQTDTVVATALVGRAGLELRPGLGLDAALRADRVRLATADRRLDDGDASGARTLAALSPLVGLRLQTRPALLYATLSTAFDAPTTTELANRPDGSGGFNPDLAPQRTRSAELGARGLAAGFLFDVAVYTLGIRDAIAPVQRADGRTAFVNRGRTRGAGVEGLAAWEGAAGGVSLLAEAAGSVARLRFGAGTEGPGGADVSGRAVPGVPDARLALRVRAARGRVSVAPELVATSAQWADDANTLRARGAVVTDVTLAASLPRPGGAPARWLPFVRVGNVFDVRATGAVVVNPTGGRFLEPTAGRSVTAGLRATL